MNAIDSVPYRRLEASGLRHKDICILIGDIVRAGGISACRDAKGFWGRGAMALLEVEHRIGGELIEDRGKTAMRLNSDKTLMEGYPEIRPGRSRCEGGILYQSRIALKEGVLLQGDSIFLHGVHSAAIPESVLVAAAGRPLTRLVDHASLSDLIVSDRYQVLPDRIIIEVRHPVIDLEAVRMADRIGALPRIMARQSGLIGRIRDRRLVTRQYASLAVIAVLLVILLPLSSGRIAPVLIALTGLAILRDALLPCSGDMKASIRKTRDEFPKM